tara:strand:+ start:42 stop:242 length:201 start_codon:yes stop_codon:yes gene_type:complete
MKNYKLKTGTTWRVEDVRHRLGKEVEHMTDEEIIDEMDNCYKVFQESCLQSGWDVIDFNFKIKENK